MLLLGVPWELLVAEFVGAFTNGVLHSQALQDTGGIRTDSTTEVPIRTGVAQKMPSQGHWSCGDRYPAGRVRTIIWSAEIWFTGTSRCGGGIFCLGPRSVIFVLLLDLTVPAVVALIGIGLGLVSMSIPSHQQIICKCVRENLPHGWYSVTATNCPEPS